MAVQPQTAGAPGGPPTIKIPDVISTYRPTTVSRKPAGYILIDVKFAICKRAPASNIPVAVFPATRDSAPSHQRVTSHPSISTIRASYWSLHAATKRYNYITAKRGNSPRRSPARSTGHISHDSHIPAAVCSMQARKLTVCLASPPFRPYRHSY